MTTVISVTGRCSTTALKIIMNKRTSPRHPSNTILGIPHFISSLHLSFQSFGPSILYQQTPFLQNTLTAISIVFRVHMQVKECMNLWLIYNICLWLSFLSLSSSQHQCHVKEKKSWREENEASCLFKSQICTPRCVWYLHIQCHTLNSCFFLRKSIQTTKRLL